MSLKICSLLLGLSVAVLPQTAIANANNTEILEEYFDGIASSDLTLSIGAKDEQSTHTEWTDITINSDEGFSFYVPWVKVTGDAKVHSLQLAPKLSALMTLPNEGEKETISLEMTHEGFTASISGDETLRNYVMFADQIAVKSIDPSPMTLDFTFQNIQSNHNLIDGLRLQGQNSVETSNLSYAFDFGGQSGSFSSVLSGISSKFDLPKPEGIDVDNPLNSFGDFQDLFVEYKVAEVTSKSRSTTELGLIKYDATSKDVSAEFKVEDKVMTMGGVTNDLAYSLTAPMLPMLFFDFNLDTATFDFAMPFENLDEVKPAKIGLKLDGLELSDNIWEQFDPQTVLPRDKANLNIDLAAGVKWLSTLGDLAEPSLGGQMPVELQDVTLNAFDLDLAGAKIRGDGAVTLDNSSFPPSPEGALNVDLKGAKGLLNNLAQIGMIEMAQVLMFTAMSNMFFTPGSEGADHLITKVELDPTGNVSVNGIPMPMLQGIVQ